MFNGFINKWLACNPLERFQEVGHHLIQNGSKSNPEREYFLITGLWISIETNKPQFIWGDILRPYHAILFDFHINRAAGEAGLDYTGIKNFEKGFTPVVFI